MMYTPSDRNFETRTPEEAKKLIENLVSSINTKKLDMPRIKSAVMYGDKNC